MDQQFLRGRFPDRTTEVPKTCHRHGDPYAAQLRLKVHDAKISLESILGIC